MSGDHNEYQKDKSYLDFECPRCGHCCQGYELGFVDGMQHQMQLSVEKALNQDLLEVLKQFSECDLNENNCATLDVATKRIRSMARAAIAKATGDKTAWVGLTDEEISKVIHGNVEDGNMFPYQFAKAIEAKLKEKNT